MSLSRDSKAERQAKAVLRAQWALRQRLLTIEWEEDVLIKVMEDIKAGRAVPALGLSAGDAFQIQAIDDHSNPTPTRKRKKASGR